jgi:acyl phosphate:glycerol-3-phosphate acyltransferase
MWPNVVAVGAGYLLGAVPFGFLIVKLFRGADVRAAGSGSTGATNVVRSAGIKAGALTYVLDVAKGAAAVLLMRTITPDPWWLGAAATAAIVGHIFPVFLKFRGGKGVATGVGAYLAVVPLAVLTTLLVWAALFWKTRMVSLASIVATALVPVWIFVWYGLVFDQPLPVATMISVGIGCLVIVAKHHENIRRLLTGTENRFERRKAEES